MARWVAALTALALGAMAAGAWVGGKHRWDGRVVMTLTGTHGIHVGDALAVVPLVVSAGLAAWCLRRS